MNKIRDAAILIQKLSRSPNKLFNLPDPRLTTICSRAGAKLVALLLTSEEEATANQLLGTQLKMD